jgi:hypothetical protein
MFSSISDSCEVDEAKKRKKLISKSSEDLNEELNKEDLESYKIKIKRTLKQILEKENEKKIFLRFLKYEHCSENILFYDDLNNYKKKSKEDKEAIQKIYIKYLQQDAEYEINISQKIRIDFETNFEKEIFAKIFDKIEIEVLILLEDSFRRFKESNFWKKYCKENEDLYRSEIEETNEIQFEIDSNTTSDLFTPRSQNDSLISNN